MNRDKNKRKWKQEWQNNWYLFKIIFRCSPGRVIGQIMFEVIGKMIWLFMTVIFLEYIFAAVEGRHSFREVILFIGCSLIGIITVEIFMNYYSRIIAPVGNQQLYERL